VPLNVDEASIRSIKGAKVVAREEFHRRGGAERMGCGARGAHAEDSMVAEKNPFPEMAKLHDHIRSAPVVKTEEAAIKGNVNEAFKSAARVVEAEYEWPFQSHASMGPGCAIVDARADGATLWTGSQKVHFARDGVAAMLDCRRRKYMASGPMGRVPMAAMTPAMPASMRHCSQTDRQNRCGCRYARGRHRVGSKGSGLRAPRARGARCHGKVIAYEFISKGFSRTHIAHQRVQAGGQSRGAGDRHAAKFVPAFAVPAESYAFDNKRLAAEIIAPLVDNCSPLRTSHFRDPLGPEIQFGSEQFIDEVAAAAGEDPVAFRLKYVTGPRDAAVIRAAAEKANWQARPASRWPKSGEVMSGRGIAYAQRSGTLVAVVAEVEVERKSGRIWAKKFTVAHDCGLIINPDGLRYTIEGNVVQAFHARCSRKCALTATWSPASTGTPIRFWISRHAADHRICLINRPKWRQRCR